MALPLEVRGKIDYRTRFFHGAGGYNTLIMQREPSRANGTQPPGGPFAALRHRNYRLYFIGQFISMCGTWLQMVAQGWLVWRLSHSEFSVGLITACGSTPMLLF